MPNPRSARIAAGPEALSGAPRHDQWATVATVQGPTLGELAARGYVLINFLRHSGCTFCREAVNDIARVAPQLRDEGCEVVIVHHSDDDRVQKILADAGIPGVLRVHDRDRGLYRRFGLSEARIEQMLSPFVMLREVEALLAGHGGGRVDGSWLQLPGAFVLKGQEVVAAFVHRSPADRPDYMAMLRLAREAEATQGAAVR